MKKKLLSPKLVQRLKNAGLLLAYLLIFVGIPLIRVWYVASHSHCANIASDKRTIGMFAYAFIFAMIVFILPYKLAKFPTKLEKYLFIFFGLAIPLFVALMVIIWSWLMCPSFIGFL